MATQKQPQIRSVKQDILAQGRTYEHQGKLQQKHGVIMNGREDLTDIPTRLLDYGSYLEGIG